MEEQKHYRKKDLEELFHRIEGKTLGDPEVDTKNVFSKTLDHKKITGIAGDVIEQSVLGYPPNQKQEPDIFIDGIETEVKTTGLRKGRRKKGTYNAKEPITMTAVSIDKIVDEQFESSHFWAKAKHMLLIFYLYDSYTTVKAAEYARFPLIGHHYHDTNLHDKEMLKHDWETVRNFLREIQANYHEPEKEYSRLSHELRGKLLLLDTAPKYPHSPRFRFKRAYAASIIEEFLKVKQEHLNSPINQFEDIDSRCNQYTRLYKGKSVQELMNLFHINSTNTTIAKKNQNVSKNICEEIVVRMFGGHAKKLNMIEDFFKIGIIAKTITLSPEGGRTEDMKLMPINFDEMMDVEKISFSGSDEMESSETYDRLTQSSYLCVVFKEDAPDCPIEQNTFQGFKRFSFTDSFIDGSCRPVWEEVRSLIVDHKLVETPVYVKGKIKINGNGVVMTSLNFPKRGRKASEKKDFFVRGDGESSDKKPLEVNGIKMYRQYFWVSGKYVVKLLSDIPFL